MIVGSYCKICWVLLETDNLSSKVAVLFCISRSNEWQLLFLYIFASNFYCQCLRFKQLFVFVLILYTEILLNTFNICHCFHSNSSGFAIETIIWIVNDINFAFSLSSSYSSSLSAALFFCSFSYPQSNMIRKHQTFFFFFHDFNFYFIFYFNYISLIMLLQFSWFSHFASLPPSTPNSLR